MQISHMRRAIGALAMGVMAVASVATAQDTSPQAPGPGVDEIRNAEFERRSAAGDLAAAALGAVGTEGVVWVGYTVAAVRADSGMCCFEQNDDGEHVCGVCRLGKRGSYTGRQHDDHDDGVALEDDKEVRVLARFEDGQLGRIRTFSASCEIDAGGARVVWLTDVDTAASVQWLARVVDESTSARQHPKHLVEGALSSLAMHAGNAAFTRLEDWATGRHPRKLREQAIFWLGAGRGEEAWPTLVNLVTESPEPVIRERAVFAAYVSEQPGTIDLLVGVARGDDTSHVRRAALMWLAQLAGDRAVAAIKDALDDPDTEIKRHAVFALSQLPVDRGVPLLIEIVRENPNPQVRKQALFWLGQTGDERALALIEELLLGN